MTHMSNLRGLVVASRELRLVRLRFNVGLKFRAKLGHFLFSRHTLNEFRISRKSDQDVHYLEDGCEHT